MRNRLTITQTTTALATSALLVLGLAACSGSGDDASTDAETTSTEETTDAAEETTDAAEETTEATEETTDATEGDAAADGDFCAAFATLTSAQEEMANIDPSDPAAAIDTFDTFTSELEGAEAPAEIASDWDAVAAGFRSLTDALEAVNEDPANADPSAAMGMLGDEAFMTSLTNVATYGAQNC